MLDEGRLLPREDLRRERNGNRDEKAALCGSVLLHALLLLVLSSNAGLIPALGSETRIDFLSLSLSPPPPEQPPPPGGPAPAAAETMQLPTRAPDRSRRAVPQAGHPPLPARQRETEGDVAPAPATAAAAPRPAGPAPAPSREAAPTSLPAPPLPSPAPVYSAPSASQALPVPPVSPAPPMTASPAPPAPALSEAALPPVANIAPPLRQPAPGPTTGPVRVAGPGAPPERAKAARSAQKPAARGETPPSSRGSAIASLKGDLKVTSTGDAMTVAVWFRPFPKSRRGREATRAEARQRTSVTPVRVEAPDRSLETVVERAGEGVYLFTVEPEHGSHGQASFILKIYEREAAEKIRSLGKRTVSGKTVLARVLMPEGLLWDDEEAFTGSIQDMDSTTKFNARTGLTWTEYDD